jgi:aryl-alcohol dehydrogenase-like predicted oxidoreductase
MAQKLEQKPLGRTGKMIPVIALGCVTFGREIDEDDSYRVMDYAVEKGLTMFDTAEAYGGGQSRLTRKQTLDIDDRREKTGEMHSSERIVGRWMRKRGSRDDITLITKFYTGGGAENVHRALEASLDRLGTDHVEIYKLHRPFPDVPVDETLGALAEEVEAGRAGVIGCSQHSAAQLREALDVSAARGYPRYEIVQPGYNLATHDDDQDLLPLCIKEELSVTPFSPMAAGFLTGKYTPDRADIPEGTRFHIMPAHADIYFNDRNFRIVDRLREKAVELGIPMARLAMAWTMTHPAITAVLVGAREPAHIDNALAAYEMGLDPALRAEMSTWGD